QLYEVLKNYPGLSRQLNCRGMLFTQYECPQTNRKEQFYVECSYIAYVISGRRIFHKNGKVWDLSEGTCVLVKKGTYTAEKPEGEKWCVMVFFIPDNYLKQIIIDNRFSLPFASLAEPVESVVCLAVNDLSRSFFLSMLPYFMQTPPPPENLLELKFKELVLSLLSNKDNHQLLSWMSKIGVDRRMCLEDIMQNNYRYNLTLDQYANLALMSLSTFKREFKKTFNEAPSKWIMKNRLELAAQLLQSTSLSVGEIGFECGFENQTHFSRIFKENMRASPLQFRLKLQARKEVTIDK
ncbi:MAG TPA: AraC family transcriptional regulator, partial [Chitinophagaceae bacterium]|nr:AraC family transcriptional regulator [Chitinophagaceae bacterium]